MFVSNLAGMILSVCGMVLSLLYSVKTICSGGASLWPVFLLVICALAETAYIFYMATVLKRIRHHTCGKAPLLILCFCALALSLFSIASKVSALPNYLLLSGLGRLDAWTAIWITPSTLTLAGSLIIGITNILLLIRMQRNTRRSSPPDRAAGENDGAS